MPIHIRNVGTNHALVLDTATDMSHLVELAKPSEYLFTFNADGAGYPPSGEYLCRLSPRGNKLTLSNDLGIVVDPVSLLNHDCYFEMEANFLNQWLVLQFEGAAP